MKNNVPKVDAVTTVTETQIPPVKKPRRGRLRQAAIKPVEWWTVRVMCVIGIVGSVFAAYKGEGYVATCLGIIGGAFLVSWTESSVGDKH